MDNLQIADLIKNVFKPDKSYSFPISKTNGRSFLYKWFDNYSWLCYSPSLDGAFCLPCVLFGDRFPTKTSTIKKLFSEPITHWNDASAAFKRHVSLGTKAGSKSGLHKPFPERRAIARAHLCTRLKSPRRVIHRTPKQTKTC